MFVDKPAFARTRRLSKSGRCGAPFLVPTLPVLGSRCSRRRHICGSQQQVPLRRREIPSRPQRWAGTTFGGFRDILCVVGESADEIHIVTHVDRNASASCVPGQGPPLSSRLLPMSSLGLWKLCTPVLEVHSCYNGPKRPLCNLLSAQSNPLHRLQQLFINSRQRTTRLLKAPNSCLCRLAAEELDSTARRKLQEAGRPRWYAAHCQVRDVPSNPEAVSSPQWSINTNQRTSQHRSPLVPLKKLKKRLWNRPVSLSTAEQHCVQSCLWQHCLCCRSAKHRL